MPKGSSEKRKFRRYDVDSVNGRMVYSSDINILNISMDGAAIATTQRLKLDREYSLRLKFEDRILVLKGRVVWSMLSHSQETAKGDVVPVYKAGISFTNILTDEAENLISYIKKCRTRGNDNRILGVRYRVSQPDSAMIDLPCEYGIKKLSLSGMLIETEISHEPDSIHELQLCIDETPVNVTGRIVNRRELSIEGITRYEIGIEFIRIHDDDRKILASFLEAMDNKK